MVSEINQTPKALRLHIGVFGGTNAGKSTLINAVSGQNISITSPVAGTTTDPVFKPMEIIPLGPVVFIDTAGLDDSSELGEIRMEKSLQQLSSCDAIILVVSAKTSNIKKELKYYDIIKEKNIPAFAVINTFGKNVNKNSYNDIEFDKIFIDLEKDEITPVKEKLISLLKDKVEDPVLTGDLVKPGDLVILTAPQDIQAPKGRLILPEVQVTRDLLDNGCMVMTVTSQNIEKAFESIKIKPALVVTDSQIFKLVNDTIPKDIPLTSFSLLMAKIKVDMDLLKKGASTIDMLEDNDKVVILESCSHHPLDGDIARIKIPMLLKKYTGKNIDVKVISGPVSPENLSEYKLAIHCGGCMLNRKAMLEKQKMFENAGVPMTNFGVAIAYMNKMLERVCY